MPSPTADNSQNDADKKSKNVEEFQLEDFLHPDSSSIRRLIEHRVLKNPNLLTEMLNVRFSDLLNLFQDILVNKEGSIEAAYLELFQVKIWLMGSQVSQAVFSNSLQLWSEYRSRVVQK